MERRKIDKWNTIIHVDEVEKIYTMFYNGKGGAVISGNNLEKVEKNFIEGMQIAESVNKLLHFKKHGIFTNEKRD